MTRAIRITGGNLVHNTTHADVPAQAARGDGGRGDYAVALGYRVGALIDLAWLPLAGIASSYFAGHLLLAAGRGLL